MSENAQLISADSREQVTALRRLQGILRQDLGAFTERCFYEIEGSKQYRHNWHLDALAYHLGLVANRHCRRLIITLPPRSLKSLSASIAFPAWLIGNEPDRRIICASYGRSLTTANTNSFRRIIRSAWYQCLFPLTRVDSRKDTEDEVRTTRGGYRLNTTVGGALTGRGGSIVIIDDPIKASDAQSETTRKSVYTWFDETLMSRLDDKRDDAIVMVMQRLHVDDLVGHVLQKGAWTHLDLAAIASEDQQVRVRDDKVHNRHVGDLLHPEREPQQVLDELRASMGSAAFSAQYLQRPVPTGGNMVKWSWFRKWTNLPDRWDHQAKTVQSWDKASKAGELNDYSVGITAMVRGEKIIIRDVARARLEYPALKKRIVLEEKRWNADHVLIEGKGSGTSLIQDLRKDMVFAVPIKPEGDKIVRMSACSARIEGGSVLLPKEADWLDEFRGELLAFPQGVHDDQVDALSQLINWIRTNSRYTLDNL